MASRSLTSFLKRRLWDWYGSQMHPAEWDGRVYGGGKVSQRFWEYFITIEMLDLSTDAIVLDIGGGSPSTGLSLFPRLLASSGVSVVVLDQELSALESDAVVNVTLERGLADREALTRAIRRHNPSHISCVSVLEHASATQQQGIFDGIQEAFAGDRAVFTFEFHEIDCHFEQQLTTKSLSAAVAGLQRYFLDRIERCPLNCENAFKDNNRLWYPLALRFERNSPPYQPAIDGSYSSCRRSSEAPDFATESRS